MPVQHGPKTYHELFEGAEVSLCRDPDKPAQGNHGSARLSYAMFSDLMTQNRVVKAQSPSDPNSC